MLRLQCWKIIEHGELLLTVLEFSQPVLILPGCAWYPLAFFHACVQRPCPRRVRAWEPTASRSLKLTYSAGANNMNWDAQEQTAPYLCLFLWVTLSFRPLYLCSCSCFSPLHCFPVCPILLSLSVLHLLSESLVLSVFTLSPCSPVSTNPTCVCTSPGLNLWLQATLHCLFYFKSLDRHTAQIKILNHCSFFFCMLCL